MSSSITPGSEPRLGLLRCPACRQPLPQLTGANGAYHCTGCGAPMALHDGLVDLLPNDDFYWGEISRAQMQALNDDAQSGGDWYRAACTHLAERRGLLRNLVDPSRLGWLFHCFDEAHHRACLDVGSGLGALSIVLTRFYDTVYSLDRVSERLRFQAIRRQQEGIGNLVLVRNGFMRLPFADASLDLVVLNGVLEWVGLEDLSQPPDVLQAQFLAEVVRVLNPQGRLYLGIENRFSALYMLGYRDHSGLPYTSLVPRAWASRMLRRAQAAQGSTENTAFHVSGGTEYRTYTYSLRGYLRLLRQAGLAQVSAMWAWQSYTYPRMSGSLDGASLRYLAGSFGNLVDNPRRRLAVRILLTLPDFILGWLARSFAPTFIFAAGKSASGGPALQDTVIAQAPGSRHFVRLTLGTILAVKTTFLLLDSRARVTASVRVIENPPDEPARFTLRTGQGIAGRLIRPHARREVALAAQWLRAYQESTRQGDWSAAELAGEMQALVESALQVPECAALAGSLQAYRQAYLAAAGAARLSVVSEHGDYTPPNIILQPDGRLQVIDWDFAQAQGNPLLDIGALYLSLLRRAPQEAAHRNRAGGPADWFAGALQAYLPVPLALTPAYYLLRAIMRTQQAHPRTPLVRFVLAEWVELLQFAITHALQAPAVYNAAGATAIDTPSVGDNEPS